MSCIVHSANPCRVNFTANSSIETDRPADFWFKMYFASISYGPSPLRKRAIIEKWNFSHVQFFSAAGSTDWITVSRVFKKTQWTLNSILGPPLWPAWAIEISNHFMRWGRKLHVPVHGFIYLYVCLSVFCVYRYKLCGWRVHANMHLCEPVWAWYASSQHAAGKKKSLFFIFLSLLNLPTSLLWSSPWQSCLPVALNSPGSYNTQ